MILIINSDKDLKPGFNDVALENLSLSALTTESYRVAIADRTRVVLVTRKGDPRIRILKDLTDDSGRTFCEVYLAPTVTVIPARA